MTNSPLDRSVRLRAMWCHLSGLAWLILSALILLIYAIDFNTGSKLGNWVFNTSIGQIFALVSYPFVGFPFTFPIFVWLLNRRIHPFVNSAALATINHTFSVFGQYILMCAISTFISFVVCGVTNKIEPVLTSFAIITLIGMGVVTSVHIATSIKAAVHASRGEVYQYPYGFGGNSRF